MQLSRQEIPSTDRWNVEALYPTPEAWVQEFKQIQTSAKGSLTSFRGRLKDPKETRALLEAYLELDRRLMKLHTYAHMRHDEDLGNDQFKSGYGQVMGLINDFQLETSWIEPELMSLGEKEFKELLSHSSLAPYRFHLEKIGRMRPHTLSPQMEELMALNGKSLDTAHKAFSALNNADMTFKSAFNSKGEEQPLTHGSYMAYMRSPDRELRRTSFENMSQGYEAHINTLTELIQGQVESHLFSTKARKFGSCLESALFPHQVDPAVYTNLIQAVRSRLPLIHEYVALRKKMLKLDQIHMYDLYAPLVGEAETEMSYLEAREAVITSVAPMGTAYQTALKKGLVEERWVDVYENAKKRSGAYSTGCYDSMPYILMNYQGTLNDVLTLAHEAGHSMHSLLSRKNQPYIYAQYPIFVAEVASTFNEQLLLQHLKTKAKSKQDLAFLVNYQIEGICATIMRQTMFAEFELQIHRWVEEGTPLTPTLLKKYWLELSRDYYGPEIVLDPGVEVGWARIPHFYYNFYVYQYATGLSASLALFEKAGKSSANRDKYLEFISSGGSKFPLDLLERAGVDMRTPAPVNAAFDHFAGLLKEFKQLLEVK